MENIRIAIVDDTKETRENIKILLGFEKRFIVIGEAENGLQAVELVEKLQPDVVLMDINMPIKDGIKATEEITLNRPETTVIIMSVQKEQEYMKKAMHVGAREFLCKPFTTEELTETIIRAYEMDIKRKEKVNLTKPHEKLNSKVITIYSSKGGVGKTTVASNLAVAIARLTRKRVALVDMDLQFGDIAIILNVSVKNTINDLIKDLGQTDSKQIDEYLVSHFSGVRVLPAPIKPEYAEYITSQHVEKIINLLKESYHYIIIDTSASFEETVLSVLDLSDEILFLSTLDLPTIKNVKTGMDVMDSLRYPQEKIKIVLNKASEQYGIKYKDFESVLKQQIWAYIPEDSQTVITSANKGFPFVMTRTETKVAKAVLGIAENIVRNEQKMQKHI
jgi:pilus assembly protein CpaE